MHRNQFRHFKTGATTFVALSLLATINNSALAQKGRLEEVIVTAQKTEENLQTVPIAITALTASDLQNAGITGYGGVALATPSISFQPFPSSTNTLILYMRGQGNTNPGSITTSEAVGVYQDGFYIGRPISLTFDLADVERVEVLRGPQGTLYGRNTTGGAVNIISKQPTGEFGFRQNLSFGNRDYFRSLTTVDLPRIGDVATKFSFIKSAIDGFVKNTGSGRDYGEEYQQAGRFQLHWDILSSLTADYFFDKGDLDSTPLYFQNPAYNGLTLYNNYVYHANSHGAPSRTYRPVDLNLSTSDFETNGLTLNWDINEQLTLKSLTGYRKLNYHIYQDYTESLGGVYVNGNNESSFHQFSQEFQFIGNFLDTWNYVVGLYYYKDGGSVDNITHNIIPQFSLDLLSFMNVTAESKSRAVFGQITWRPEALDNRLGITGGLRYTKDDKEASRESSSVSNLPFPSTSEDTGNLKKSFSKTNPTITVDYQWTDDLSTYLKFATGYRAGGFYEANPIGLFGTTFAPENVDNYEFGLKSYWWDQRVRANLAAFWTKYKDMQLSLPTDTTNPGISQMYNAGRATIKGVELELVVAPIEDLTFQLDYTYLRAYFNQVRAEAGSVFDPRVNLGSPYQVGDDIKDLFAMAHAPKHSVNLSADYTFVHFDKGDVSAHLNYRWQDWIWQIAGGGGPAVPGRDYNLQPSYGLLDGRLTLRVDLPRGDQAKVSLWGKNIAHNRYIQSTIGLGGGAVPINGSIAGFNSAGVAWAEPPSYGVDLEYKY